jgi:hypothetical protein
MAAQAEIALHLVERNAEHFAKLQRQDVEAINLAGEAELAHRGMVVNRTDTESIRARLGDFYARWRARFDPSVWVLAEGQR